MASTHLTVGKGLQLPLDAVTQTFAILGKRGSGKTTTAVVLVEELLRLRQPVVVLDPLDVSWGLRASRDGTAAGFPITVLGGEHADLPLEATAGAVIAEFVVESHAPLILSLRHFSIGEQRRFVTDFCERLYALKGKQANRTALHLVIDEVDEFAPQRIPAGHERMFGAIDRIVRRGRSAGLGVTMISQRAAVIHKDILSQAEVLICHQTISPQDRKALEAWIEAHDAHGQRAAFMDSLASLARGEAWVWSPGWLDLFARFQIRDRTTFDSSATPKAGEVAAAPARLAAVDLKALEGRMVATLERAKADDPQELRRRIAALERELAARVPAQAPPPVPVLGEEERALLERVTAHLELVRDETTSSVRSLTAMLEAWAPSIGQDVAALRAAVAKAHPSVPPKGRDAFPLKNVRETGSAPRNTSRSAELRRPTGDTAGGALGKAERAILTVLAQHPDGCEVGKLTLLSGYRYSGGFRNSLSALRTAGYLEGQNVGVMRITSDGRRALGPVDPLPRGAALRAYWASHPSLGKAERAILEALYRQPRGLTKEQLCAATGYEFSGGFRNALSALRTAGLLEGPNTGTMRVAAVLLEA